MMADWSMHMLSDNHQFKHGYINFRYMNILMLPLDYESEFAT